MDMTSQTADSDSSPDFTDTAIDAPNVIGRIISVSTKQSPSFSVMHVRLKHSIESLSPGSWVSVDAGRNTRVLARVVDAWENNPHEDAQSSLISEVLPFKTIYAIEGDSTVIYRALEIEPMEQVELDDAGNIIKISEVTMLPRAGNSVYIAEESAIIGSLGLEPNPDEGLEVGTLRGFDHIKAVITKSAIQRHIFIGGGIGSGKSYTRGVLAEELHMLGIPQINIDVNGEMIEATNQLGGVNLIPGKDGFTLPLSSLTPEDVTDAIPGLNKGTNYVTLIEYAHGVLLKERATKGQHFGIADLVAKITEVAPSLDMDKAGTLRPATQRAQSLERIAYIGNPFNWEQHIKPGAIINIDCRGLLVSDLRLIVASIARDLQRLSRTKTNMFVAFSIDEFHLVAPNDDKSVTTQVLREIARIGRHYKIGLILTTQSPQDVDRSILKRLLTRFLHSIEPDQLDALRGVFSDASESLIKSLPKLPQGTAIVTGAFETIRHAAVINIRKRHTIHGGKTPDIFADFKQKGWSGKHPINLVQGDKNAE
jgi:uncharacterized protein